MKIKHIGYFSLCRGKYTGTDILRLDLGKKRYRSLDAKERFKDENPYRVCKRRVQLVPAKQ